MQHAISNNKLQVHDDIFVSQSYLQLLFKIRNAGMNIINFLN